MVRISQLTASAAALALSVCVVTGAQAGGLKDATPPPAKKWLPWIKGGGFLSTEQHRAESNLFAPIWQSSVALVFFQGTGKYFEDDIREGNFALGFRKMQRSGWNFGLWGGYDVRHSEFDNTFHQISFGFEALSDRWDVRVNGYVAVSDPEASADTARVFLSGNTILMTGGEEVPLSGFDGEVGYKVFGTHGGHGGGTGRSFDIGADNSGTIANNTLNGTFGTDIILLQGGGNALVGDGNVLNATFGGLFCNDAGGNADTNIAFTNGLTCP